MGSRVLALLKIPNVLQVLGLLEFKFKVTPRFLRKCKVVQDLHHPQYLCILQLLTSCPLKATFASAAGPVACQNNLRFRV